MKDQAKQVVRRRAEGGWDRWQRRVRACVRILTSRCLDNVFQRNRRETHVGFDDVIFQQNPPRRITARKVMHRHVVHAACIFRACAEAGIARACNNVLYAHVGRRRVESGPCIAQSRFQCNGIITAIVVDVFN